MPPFPISYPDDKPGAGAAAGAAGHRLRELDGVWVADADDQAGADAAQAWLDGYDDLTAQRAAAKQRTNDLASERILARFPMWMQSNLNARANELNWKRGTVGLTPAEEAEVARLLGAFDSVVTPVRTASNLIAADIDAMTATEAHEFDPAASPRWPG